MGADISKENNRSNTSESRNKRTQRQRYVLEEATETTAYFNHTYQSPLQSPVERSRKPYSYTTESLPSPVMKQANQPSTLERARQPYNYNTEELQTKQSLYPNLNIVNRGDEGFVYVNYGEQRSNPPPSAPPASEVNIPTETRTRPIPPYAASNNAPGPSKPANSPAMKNMRRSAARGRGNNDSLSCPTCAQRLGLTIFQCDGGHSSCKDCRLANRTCGTCSSPITDMRNIMLEAYIAELKTPCQNQGCTLKFNSDEMERHLKECPFGEMACPMGTYFGQCSVRCKVANMAAHFDDCHKEQRTAEIDKEMYVFNICAEAHKLFLIKNGPFNFLVHVKVGEIDRKISLAVQLLGTKISAAKWSYEFHVYNKRQPLRKFLYVDSCQSISTPVSDIFNENQCATLPLTFAMSFINEGALTYKFYIKKAMNQRGHKGRPINNTAN